MISPEMIPQYENQIREKCSPKTWALADLFNEGDRVVAALSQALYEKRLER
jgi:hypothetical protein